MGTRRQKRMRNAKGQREQPREELDLVREKEMDRVELEDAERRAKVSRRHLPVRPSGGPPPILGEPDPLVRAPLKPRPLLRSGAIALEPEPEDSFVALNPKTLSK